MSKLSIHLQSVPEWVPEFVRRSGVQWIKWLDPPEQEPDWCAGVKVIGRTFEPDSVSNERIKLGKYGARDWFARWAETYASRPWVHCWEGPNEPQPMWESSFRAKLNEFTVELADLMHTAGRRLVGMNWSVGWPDIGTAAEMGEGVQACDYLGLHEYSAPTMQQEQGFLCLRYRRTVAELEAAGFVVPPIIVSECGIDGGVIQLAGKAWRTFCDGDFDGCYLPQLAWYSGELDMDHVKAATIFTVCDWDWFDFRIEEPQAMALADWIAQDVQPLPDRARGIDVSQWQGDINWQAVADSGIEFAMIRATVGLRTDPYFYQNWQGAGDAGLLRGVYHYLESDTTGQAAHFVSTVSDRVPELGYWGDLEQGELTADKCRAFLQAVDRNLDYLDMCNVYTSAGFFDRFGTPDWTWNRLLWVAHWTDNAEPTLPEAWTEWEFWQTTSDGAVPGIVGRVDLDVFDGTSAELREKYRKEQIPDMEIKVFDKDGNEQTWEWLVANYGPLTVAIQDGPCYRVVELHEKWDDSAFIAQVRDGDGNQQADVNVVFYWPDAPALPEDSGWLGKGVVGMTTENGDVGFGMGPGAYYYPPDAGPHKCWLYGDGVSDMLEGIGMLGGTNHNHVNVVYQWVEDEPEPPEPPEPPDDLSAVVEAVDRNTAELARVADAVTFIVEHWPFG